MYNPSKSKTKVKKMLRCPNCGYSIKKTAIMEGIDMSCPKCKAFKVSQFKQS